MTDPTQDTPLGAIRDKTGSHPATRVVAAGLDTGRDRIATPDAYIEAQSPFDRHARIGLPQTPETRVDRALFLQYLTTQVMAWTDTELDALERIVETLRPVFAGIGEALPETVHLVKTTGREEGAAAYTRHTDTIVLPINMIASIQSVPAGGDPLHPARSDAYLAGIVTHEFFHILSKNNPDWRRALYALLDFALLETPVTLPDDIMASGLPMNDLKITNPDAPLIDVTTAMTPPGGDHPEPMAPALISRSAYAGGEFFATLDWIFLQLDDGGAVLRRNGRSVWHEAREMMPQYLEKIGRNLTGELFHPDEVLAQSFVIAAHQPSLGLLSRISAGIWPDRNGR